MNDRGKKMVASGAALNSEEDRESLVDFSRYFNLVCLLLNKI